MVFNDQNPFISVTFVKGIVSLDTLSDINEKIIFVCEREGVDQDLGLYYFVKTLLDRDLFF